MNAHPAPESSVVDASRAFVARVADRYPIELALIFGSRARGDARADSDVDIAIVFDGRSEDMRKASVDMAGDAFDIMMEAGLFLSPIAISLENWRNPEGHSNPFLIRNIKRDGVTL